MTTPTGFHLLKGRRTGYLSPLHREVIKERLHAAEAAALALALYFGFFFLMVLQLSRGLGW